MDSGWYALLVDWTELISYSSFGSGATAAKFGTAEIEVLTTDIPLLLHESIVDESEIDTLGHVNVRCYAERAVRANVALMNRLGILADTASGTTLRRVDTYIRYQREQVLGAPLNTYGGILCREADDVGLTAYLEIRNVDRDEIAASYIMTSTIVENQSQRRLGMTVDKQAVSDFTFAQPEHGRPRSLSLTPPARASFEELVAMVPDNQNSEFNGRWEGRVSADDCDAQGWLKEELDLSYIAYRKDTAKESIPKEPTVMTDKTGRRFGWAMVEARFMDANIPTVGETVVCLGADTRISEKWRQTRRWFFSKETQILFGISDHIGMYLDLESRRIIPIPEELRQQLESNALPQYA